MITQNINLSPDAIMRETAAFSDRPYDLIVVGGGIYGVMLSLEAARRNLSTLLLEQDDFGEHTSYNHLRILHGGLRYLQSFDLKRYRDSVQERSWFLRHFPHLCKPLDCLLPLYNDGLRRPSVFRIALALDSLFSMDRNFKLSDENRLRSGIVLSPIQTVQRFPLVNPLNLRGGALWQDGFVPDSPRLLIELLRWACLYGTRALNYCSVKSVLSVDKKVRGVRALDKLTGIEYEYRAPVVINATGPWCRDFSRASDCDRPDLFNNGVLVWNLLFNRPALCDCAVAVSSQRHNAHTYFIPPWKNRLLIGTGHVPLVNGEHRLPSSSEICSMIEDCNEAIPGLDLLENDVSRVFWGIMPGDAYGNLASRHVFIDHGANRGPQGLFSISGEKFTTARGVADRILSTIFKGSKPRVYSKKFTPLNRGPDKGLHFESISGQSDDLLRLVSEESVQKLSDLVLRRTDIDIYLSNKEIDINPILDLFSWSASRRKEEVDSLQDCLNQGVYQKDR